MNRRLFVGDLEVDALPGNDRGLAYGDGLFETMRAHAGRIHWWPRHYARLDQGARRLRIALPSSDRMLGALQDVLDGRDGVAKLLVTRGGGGRGYAPPASPVPHWMVAWYPLPAEAPAGGLTLRWCDLRLGAQPALAGLKHCNRLEQVLARGEWTDGDIHEGLLRGPEGEVVGATAANVFVLDRRRWLTPAIERCGVAGVCRGWAMEALDALETHVDADRVESADAVFLCNAVRGILPVARLGTHVWQPHPQVAALRRRLAAEHPAFAMPDRKTP